MNVVWRRRWRAMGSTAVAAIVGDPRLLDSAAQLVSEMEQLWSRFIPTSDVCRLNAANSRVIAVDPLTIRLLTTMAEATTMTGGHFDPTLLAPLVGLGYRSPIAVSIASAVPRPAGAPGHGGHPMWAVRLSTDGRPSAQLPPGLAIDAGGIGKGLAADICLEHLLSAGASAALVSLGGDMAVGGSHPWTIDVGAPRIAATSGPLARLRLSSGGVATSGSTARRWRLGGRIVHHVVDPRTRQPTAHVGRAIIQATVAADHGRWAEALATEVMVGGEARLDELDGRGVATLAVRADGSQRHTAAWRELVAA